MHNIDVELDVSGYNCPVPLMKTKKVLLGMQPGQVLKVTTTTADSIHEFNVFSRKFEHDLLESEQADGKFHFYLRKGISASASEAA